MIKSIHARMVERRNREGSSPKPTDEQVAKIKEAFRNNPNWDDLYLFHDGYLKGGDVFRGEQSSRTAQLVSISSQGIPVNIGRGHSQIRMEVAPAKGETIRLDATKVTTIGDSPVRYNEEDDSYNVFDTKGREHKIRRFKQADSWAGGTPMSSVRVRGWRITEKMVFPSFQPVAKFERVSHDQVDPNVLVVYSVHTTLGEYLGDIWLKDRVYTVFRPVGNLPTGTIVIELEVMRAITEKMEEIARI